MNIKKEYSRFFKVNTPFKIKREAFLVLIAGLTITMAFTFQSYRNVEKNRREEFAAVYNEIKHKITARLHAHALILRAGSAYLSVSDTVSRAGWKNFIEYSKIEKNLPGILGIGYSIIIPADHLNEHILSVRKEGFPDYTIYPDNPRTEYTSIIYLEPFSGRNLRAFGYDMFSEPVRRKAMELSRDNDVAMLSGRVNLVQETKEDIQFGTLMYVPFYKPGKPVNTVEQRREAILGWVYSPYRMNDLMKGILGHWEENSRNQIQLKVFDDLILDTSLLYDSNPNSSLIPAHPINAITLPVEFNGKKWVLYFAQSGEHAFYSESSVLVVFVSGIIISVLLLLLSISYLELKASKLRFQTIFNKSPLGIALIDSHSGHIYEVNPQFAEITGRTMEVMVNIDWMQITHPDDIQEDLDNMVLLNAGQISGFKMEKRYLKPDGKYVWINMTIAPVPIDENDNALHLCMIEDITERKATEEKLKVSEEHFHSLFNNMAEGVGLHELVFENGKPVNYRIVDVNNPFLDIIGASREQIVGKLATEAYGTPDPPYFEEYARVGISKTPLDFETYFAPLDRHFSVSVAPWQRNGFATIFSDITDSRKAEAEIKLKNEELLKVNVEKDKFFSIIAHDLRSPLGTFLGFTQLMAEELPEMQLDDLQQMVERMERSASNLYSLLENLLEWAKIQQGLVLSNPVVIQLNSVVGECLEILIESIKKKELQLTNEIPDEILVFADANMLQSIIRNLVSNAVKFTGNGGKIILSAKSSDSKFIEISVQDSGIGMSPMMLENLFQLNSQISRKGTEGEPSTGLGLLLCKEFIEKSGGKIRVESEEGKGSTFRFTIPVRDGRISEDAV